MEEINSQQTGENGGFFQERQILDRLSRKLKILQNIVFHF